MTTQRTPALEIGTAIPSLSKRPTSRQLVLWAAASGDFYQVHYDSEFAKSTGLSGIIVHGALKHGFLGQMLWDWATPLGGTVIEVEASYRGLDFPDVELTCKGVISGVEPEADALLVTLDVWVERPDGQRTTPGSAIVRLPCP